MAFINSAPDPTAGTLSRFAIPARLGDAVTQENTRFEAQQTRDRARNDQIIERMLRDPANAKAVSQAYGVPITPELDAVLQQPATAQKILEANKISQSLGIDNPDARRKFAETYLQTGDIMQAGQAIEGIDTRKPLSQYEQARLGTMENIARIRGSAGAGGGGNRQRAIPPTFIKSVESMINTMRGVKYADNNHTYLLEGSPAPLSPEAIGLLSTRAAEITQATGDPLNATSQAFKELGGEAGLVDDAESPFAYGDATQGVRPDLGKAKYRRFKPQGQQQGSVPQDAFTVPPAPDASSGLAPLPGLPSLSKDSAPAVQNNSGPVRVKSRAEAQALPSGTVFITPDGRTKVVP